METRAPYVIVGAFVIVILIGIFGAVVWLAQLQFRREGAIYDIYFRGSVSGLSEGAPVRYKGVPIGRVLSIRLDPENVERIRVRIEVDTGTPIKEDNVAALETQGITGQAFVQITGGSNASPNVKPPPGKSYPVIASRASQLEEVVSAAPKLLNRAVQLSDRIMLVLSDENRNAIAQTLNNLDVITGTMAKRSEDVDRIIVDAAGTIAELHGMAQNANAVLARVNGALNGKDGISDKITVTLDEFDRSAKALSQISGHLDGILQENRAAFRDFSQRGLGQAEQLIIEARALVTELNHIADQFDRDPARFLFGNRREGYQPR